MRVLALLLALPFIVALALLAHASLARALKAVLWSVWPLSDREPEAAVYERRVYHTATRPMMEVVALAAASGAVGWLSLALTRFAGWAAVAGVGVFVAAVALDLLRWERVAATATHLWFQRGMLGTVHSIALEDLKDVAVEEMRAGGFTLRHFRRNRLVRLTVRTATKAVITLPKTDVHGGLDAVEALANHIRLRLDHDRQKRRPRIADADAEPVPDGDDLVRAIAHLKRSSPVPDTRR